MRDFPLIDDTEMRLAYEEATTLTIRRHTENLCALLLKPTPLQLVQDVGPMQDMGLSLADEHSVRV